MNRVYHYIGARELQQVLNQPSDRAPVLQPGDVLTWIEETQQEIEHDRSVIATFIIDTTGQLWIADRRSEHVLCAAGQPVLAAGEITFVIENQDIWVSEITNQSAGYCPEPEAWPEVATTLDDIGLDHPGDFTTAYIFRRCTQCEAVNIVKEEYFVCGVCDAELSSEWNF
jgi:hypothetical protein